MKNKNVIVVFMLVMLLLLVVSMKYTVFTQFQKQIIKIIPTDYEAEVTLRPVSGQHLANINLGYSLFVASLEPIVNSGAMGEMVVNFTKSYIEVRGNLSNIPADKQWLGGAGIVYGQWLDDHYYHPGYVLPKNLTELPNIILFYNYTIYKDISTLPLNSGIILFIPDSIERDPDDYIYVIIRLYRPPNTPPMAGNIVVKLPIFLNGTLVKADFNVWSLVLGTDAYIVFDIISTSFGGVSLSVIEKGEVGISVQKFINTSAEILTKQGWSKEKIYDNILQAIAVGTVISGSGIDKGGFM